MTRSPATGLPVVVTLDLEPDLRVIGRDGATSWSGVDPTIATIERWRADLPGAAVHWAWRCDPAIAEAHGDPGWALARWRGQIVEATTRGDAVGVHPHFWRWSDPLGTFVVDAADDAWKAECIERSVTMFTRVVGRPPQTCQIGDGYFDAAILGALVEHRIGIDLTLEPGAARRERHVHTELTTGTIPDRARVPRVPFHPKPRNPLRAGRRGASPLWEIPLTTSTEPLVVDGVVVDPPGTVALLGLAPSRFRHAVTTGLAASVAAGAPYLNVMGRSDAGADAGLTEHTVRNLEWLRTGMRGLAEPWGEVRFVTPDRLLDLLGLTRA